MTQSSNRDLFTMIHWLVQSATEEPSIARGIAIDGLLSQVEAAQLATYSVEKRRRDWLLGRWTAKELVRTVAQAQFGLALEPAQIAVLNDADGAPFARLTENRLGSQLGEDDTGRLPWSLSISHSHDVAFCAVSLKTPTAGLSSLQKDQISAATDTKAALIGEEDDDAVGADLEFIEAREDSFVQDFFTPAEMALVHGAPDTERARVVTAVWSAKEAVLKALRTGLRLDTRQVECLIRPPLPVIDEWMTFPISIRSPDHQGFAWSGWLRRDAAYPKFVMTLVQKSKIED